MRFQSFKTSRNFHKWTGFVCAIFFLMLAVSGILLMHRDSLELDKIEVEAKYLPDKYFKMIGEGFALQALTLNPKNPSIMFVGTQNGLFRSKDRGSTWTQLHEGMRNENVRAVAIHPIMPQLVFAATERGIYVSETGGDFWSGWIEESSGLRNIDVRDLKFDPNNPEVLYAATADGVYKSDDEGDIWQASFKPEKKDGRESVRFIRFSSKGKTIYIATDSGIFRSQDEGETWTRQWDTALPSRLKSLVSLDTEPEFLYAGFETGLYKSFNHGILWVPDEELNTDFVHGLFVNPKQTTELFAATSESLYHSADGGDHWQVQAIGGDNEIGLDFISIQFPADMKAPMMLAASRTQVLLSLDGGENWKSTGLAEILSEKTGTHLTMDLVKLLTEIHTGRFFGDLVFVLVDVSTVGLILLIFSGISLTLYRRNVTKSKKLKERLKEESQEVPVDAILDIQETADDLSQESHQIHDMIEHINSHLAKCRTIYMTREKKEIEKIGEHIVAIDKKMHHLMERIEEFDKLSQN
ncbi:PepSY domain-containing protein [Nitrospina gracilis]|uniref:PepSY domain-containing protein n=1 Tax=Nitrospina gracilis TaxID=35801 RepID=UPI001F3A9E31|nr:hypothetical protein [Nitrospina gracilis]MCF8720582.1 photosystem II stability/assembly factor-like uncharacterized protein [Nitrospina gracilis Nb-211]